MIVGHRNGVFPILWHRDVTIHNKSIHFQVFNHRAISTHASLIPRDPVPQEKYTSVIQSPIDPSKVKDLRTAGAEGPKGIILFGFSPSEQSIVESWLHSIDNTLTISSFEPTSFSPDATLKEVLCILDPEYRTDRNPMHDGDDTLSNTLQREKVVLFSGLCGLEVEGLSELWAENTGFKENQIKFASVAERLMNKRLDGLLSDIIRANSPSPSLSAGVAPFTLVDNKGQMQATNKDELRHALQRTVMEKKRQKEVRRKDDDETDVEKALRKTSKLKSGQKKGFA